MATSFKNLPYCIPGPWVTEEEALKLGYKKKPNFKKTYAFIDTNESMFNFSTSNIGFSNLQNYLGLRLEGFLLRIRYAVYTILITCLTSFPLACSLSIFLIELLHILLYIYYVARYRYAKNWFLFVSKANVSVAILTITSIGILLSVSSGDPMSFSNQVSPAM